MDTAWAVPLFTLAVFYACAFKILLCILRVRIWPEDVSEQACDCSCDCSA